MRNTATKDIYVGAYPLVHDVNVVCTKLIRLTTGWSLMVPIQWPFKDSGRHPFLLLRIVAHTFINYYDCAIMTVEYTNNTVHSTLDGVTKQAILQSGN